MKAALILVPSESRKLIAKGIAAMKGIRDARRWYPSGSFNPYGPLL
jgi:hypothetical protein